MSALICNAKEGTLGFLSVVTIQTWTPAARYILSGRGGCRWHGSDLSHESLGGGPGADGLGWAALLLGWSASLEFISTSSWAPAEMNCAGKRLYNHIQSTSRVLLIRLWGVGLDTNCLSLRIRALYLEANGAGGCREAT